MTVSHPASVSRRVLVALCAALVALTTFVFPTAPAEAADLGPVPGGPVILDGNDPGDHGSATTPYLQNVYDSLDANVSAGYAHNGETAVIGTCASYMDDMGTGQTFVAFDTASAIEGLFSDIGNNNYKHIHICSDNDQPSTLPSNLQDELDKWGSAIVQHVNRGGGLYGSGHQYNWLGDLFPAIDVTSGGTSESYVTADGADFFPTLSENDLLNAINHYTFTNVDDTPLLPLLTASPNGAGLLVAIGGTTVRFPQVLVDGPVSAEVGTDETFTLRAATADGVPISNNSFSYQITGPTSAAGSGTGVTDGDGRYDFTFAADSVGETRVSVQMTLATGEYAGTAATTVWATVPGPPIITSATDVPGETGSVLISWNAPDDGGRPLVDYVVEFSPDGENWTVFDDGVTTDTSVTVSGLENAVPYQFRVTAVNDIGAGAASDEETGMSIGSPTAPTSVEAVKGDSSATVTWSAPDSDGGAVIDSYTLQYRAVGSGTWIDVADVSSPEAVGSLNNGTAYEFRVAAVNSEGTGTWSSPIEATPSTVPGTVSDFSVVEGDEMLTFEWSEPADDGGSEVTGYVVTTTLGTTSQPCAPELWHPDPNPSGRPWYRCTFTNLTNGLMSTFGVAAENADGTGAALELTGTPYGLPTAPADLAVDDGDAAVDVSWAPADGNGRDIDSYNIYVGDALWNNVEADVFSSEVTGLTNGNPVDISVRAVNLRGEGPAASLEATPFTVPAAPVVTVDELDGRLNVSWEAPDDNGRPITAYEVLVDGVVVDTLAGDVTGVEISDLTNGATYDVDVRAENEAGFGPAGSVSGSPYGQATAPTDLDVTDGDTTADLTWSPADGNGRPITAYEVLVDGGVVATLTATAESYEVTGLTNGDTYDISVRGVTEFGAGQPIEGEAAPFTVPDAPVIDVTEGDAELGVSWEPVSDNGRPVGQYQITVDGIGVGVVPAATTAFTITEDGAGQPLANGQTYTVEVVAINAAGDSPAGSANASPYGAPASPSVTATAGDEKVGVSWTEPDANGRDITSYRVYVNDALFDEVDAASFSVEVPGLTNGQTYTVEVAAVNLAGEGDAGSESTVPFGLPAAPDVMVTELDGILDVTWEVPDDNGSVITRFHVSVNGEFHSFTPGPVVEVAGLANGDDYLIEVRAENLAGVGSAGSVTASPYGPASAPGVTVIEGDETLDVSWTEPDGNGRSVTGYQVYLNGTPVGPYAAGTTSTTFEDLGNSTSYEVDVAALTQFGEGQRGSDEGVPFGPAFAPQVNATPADESANLAWTNADGNGRPVLGYNIYLDEVLFASQEAEFTSLPVVGLTNGQSYDVAVRAVTAAGEGKAAEVTFVPFGPPAAPDVSVTQVGDGTFTVTWSEADGNGRSVTGYEVWVDGELAESVDAATTSHAFTDLTNGHDYQVQVRAVNEGGPGHAGSASAMPFTSPGAPTVNVSGDNGDLEIRWQDNGDGGRPIESVTITVTGEGETRTVTLDSADDTFSLAGLPSGVYTVTVVVTNQGGAQTESTFTYTLTDTAGGFEDTIGTTFSDDVAWLEAVGVTKGCNPPDNTLFCPDDVLTRAQVAAFLDRYFDPADTQTDAFTDDDGHLFEAELNRTNGASIFRGCNPPANDLVCPDRVITRGQLAAVIFRAFQLEEAPQDQPAPFVDSADHHFQREIAAIAAVGITRGCNPQEGNTDFCPDELVTRGQIAAMLRRASEATDR